MAMEQAQAAPSPQGSGGGSPADSLKSLVGNISNGLSVLGEVAAEAGMGEGFNELNQQFQALVEQMMSGGGQAQPQAQGPGTGIVSPEQGAAQARPAGMRG